MVPEDALVGGDTLRAKCIHDNQSYIVHAANPGGNTPRTDNPRIEQPTVNIQFPAGSYRVEWFNPHRGTWESESTISARGFHPLKPPSIGRILYGDWVILIQTQGGI